MALLVDAGVHVRRVERHVAGLRAQLARCRCACSSSVPTITGSSMTLSSIFSSAFGGAFSGTAFLLGLGAQHNLYTCERVNLANRRGRGRVVILVECRPLPRCVVGAGRSASAPAHRSRAESPRRADARAARAHRRSAPAPRRQGRLARGAAAGASAARARAERLRACCGARRASTSGPATIPALPREQRSRWGKDGWDIAEQRDRRQPQRRRRLLLGGRCMGNYALGLGVVKALSQGMEEQVPRSAGARAGAEPGLRAGRRRDRLGPFLRQAALAEARPKEGRGAPAARRSR